MSPFATREKGRKVDLVLYDPEGDAIKRWEPATASTLKLEAP